MRIYLFAYNAVFRIVKKKIYESKVIKAHRDKGKKKGEKTKV